MDDRVDNILMETFEKSANTFRATVFPLAQKDCTECGCVYTNTEMIFTSVGYYHEVLGTAFKWFCSMICVIKHQKKEEGIRELQKIDLPDQKNG